ncbi:MAG: hypothetical protein ACXV7I_13290, partial [Ilumatobacteraceae bacterium]
MKVGATVFGLALGGGLLAGSLLGAPGTTSAASKSVAVVAAATGTAGTDTASSTAATAATPAVPATPETPLTGDVATQVAAAAQAAVPGGTIDRVETDNDGV